MATVERDDGGDDGGDDAKLTAPPVDSNLQYERKNQTLEKLFPNLKTTIELFHFSPRYTDRSRLIIQSPVIRTADVCLSA